VIRLASEKDAEGVLEIYAPVVLSTPASFEVEPPSVNAMRARILETIRDFPWLVNVENEALLGYAYASRHKVRPAYQWSVDVSVYVHPNAHRRGIGRALYVELFDMLRGQGYFNAFAGITLPNEASVGLHTALGFEPVGVYRNVGYKLGKWHDVGWWQLELRETTVKPPMLGAFAGMQREKEFGAFIQADMHVEL
jgi:L-amino acid N-acyltransferase YncA